MSWITRPTVVFFLLISLTVINGCYEMNRVDGGPTSPSEWVGEVSSVDSRRQEIELRTDDKRLRTIRFDNRTRVIYRDREYEVRNLEAGDYVAIQIGPATSGPPYADVIRVRESVQDRGGTAGRKTRTERIEGTVDSVDPQRGLFELRDLANRRITVSLPYRPARPDEDRFRSLRTGDRVRLEGRFLNPERFELEAFL